MVIVTMVVSTATLLFACWSLDEERERTIMFLVDGSASGAFGTVSRFKSELAAELCALLAFSATRNNDRVGLITFTDRIEKVVPPKKGRVHVFSMDGRHVTSVIIPPAQVRTRVSQGRWRNAEPATC